MTDEAIQRAYIGSLRGQLHALRGCPANAERIERAEAALWNAEAELDRLVAGHANSRLAANEPAVA
jgi:hypothetical protein